MRRRLNLGSDRGAAAVEFALVFPLLILVLFGIIEFGSIYNTQLELTSAAREGAREMAISGDPAAARTAAVSAAVGLNPALTTANVTVSATACTSTTNVTVTLNYNKPYLTGLFGATIALAGEATRRCYG